MPEQKVARSVSNERVEREHRRQRRKAVSCRSSIFVTHETDRPGRYDLPWPRIKDRGENVYVLHSFFGIG